jgi:hypothetical protein
MAAGLMAFGALTMAAQTSATVKDDLFTGTEMFAKGATDVTEVTMDPQTLGMVGGKDSAKAHRTVLNVVRTYSYDKPGMYKIEDVETFRNKLNTGDWHCSVHTRSLKTGESTDICNKQRTDDLDERAIITVSPKSLTFIHTIRKKGDYGSEVGDMPLSLMMGLHGLSSMAMLDPDSIAEMAMLKAQMGTMGVGPFGTGSFDFPKTFTIEIPNSESKDLLDAAKKLQNDNKNGFLLAVPRAQEPGKSLEKTKPAPSQPQ